MAAKIANRGLQIIGGRASNTADAFSQLLSISVDDSTVAFAATDTALNSGGAVANVFAQNFDATPTRVAQTTTHVMTVPLGSGNFTVRRVALHNLTGASVTASSTSLFGGIDGQSLTKTPDFTLALTLAIVYADAS